MNSENHFGCGTPDHWSRRTLLKAAGASGLGWLTPLADSLALDAEKSGDAKPQSVIVLFLSGGPSQLETFDPHPNSPTAYGGKAIDTPVKGLQLAESLPLVAERAGDLSIVRSVVSKEGDHSRATYNFKTGYRLDPTIVHPSIGAVVCHELPDAKIDIPTHISILPGNAPARGGYLGAQFDAFQIGDPTNPIPDVRSPVSDKRDQKRRESLSVVEQAFGRGRPGDLDEKRTLHRDMMANARRMMTSDQLRAFDVKEAPAAERKAYGDSPFGRGCLAAVRLIEAGVRCVEVTLGGWDTHANNLNLQKARGEILDAAFASLIDGLKERGLFESTIVLCGGEFGRTPKQNLAEGRDHWPHGFSVALAGGNIRGGYVHGSTDPSGEKQEPGDPVQVEDLHATVQHALGIDYEYEYMAGPRPIALSEGKVVEELLI